MDYDRDAYDNDVSADHDYYYYGDDDYDKKDFFLAIDQTIYLCLLPTLYETLKSILHVFLWSFLFRLSTQVIQLRSDLQHLICSCVGLASLYFFFSTTAHFIISLVITSYILLRITSNFRLITLASLAFLVTCELWLVDSTEWHKIRGAQMIIVMKSVSLSFDLDIGIIQTFPNVIQYSGYILCPGTCIFGPWNSFNDYLQIYERPQWDFRWLKRILISFLLAIMYLSISTCVCHYVLPNVFHYVLPANTWKWFISYRDALSFRTSHYFISHLSKVTSGLSGFDELSVTSSYFIEFPRSLNDVVKYWNIPMHYWLKVYVLNTSRRFGKALAFFITYTVSALLHGLNFQLTAVLFLLGVYSGGEFMLREKLAHIFNACILARRCRPNCIHRHKPEEPLVFLTNLFLSIIAMIHLIFLGMVFESNSQQEEIGYSYLHMWEKWHSLNYLSIYIAIFTWSVYFVI